MVPYRKSSLREQYASSDLEYHYRNPSNMTDETFNENMVRHNVPVNNPLRECYVFSDSDEETEYVQRVYREIPKKVYPPKKLHKGVQCESEMVELSGILKLLSNYCFENAKKCELEELINISKWVGVKFLGEHNDQSPTVTSSFCRTSTESGVQRDCSGEPRVCLKENSCFNNEKNECNNTKSNVFKEGINNKDTNLSKIEASFKNQETPMKVLQQNVINNNLNSVSGKEINISKRRVILNSSSEKSVGSSKKRKKMQISKKSKSVNNKQKNICEKSIRNASSIESEVKSIKQTIKLSKKQETPIKDLQQNLNSSKLNSVSGKQINISKRRGILNNSSEESDVESDKQTNKGSNARKSKSVNGKHKNNSVKSIPNTNSKEPEVESTKQSGKMVTGDKSVPIINKEKSNSKNMNPNNSSVESKMKNIRQPKKMQIADKSINNKQKSRIMRANPKHSSDEPETEDSKVTKKLLVGDKLKCVTRQKSKIKRTNQNSSSDESEMEYTHPKRKLLTYDKTKSVLGSQKNGNKRIVRNSSSDDPDFKIYNPNAKKKTQKKTQRKSSQQYDVSEMNRNCSLNLLKMPLPSSRSVGSNCMKPNRSYSLDLPNNKTPRPIFASFQSHLKTRRLHSPGDWLHSQEFEKSVQNNC